MKLVDLARELMITTQELRRELNKTNFGISPTAHEIDDSLAMGVLRFLKGKVKPTLKARRVLVMKDGKEVIEEKPPEEKKKEEKPDEKTKKEEVKKPETIIGEIQVESRAAIPRPGSSGRAESQSAHVSVSRRIEIDSKTPSRIPTSALPKHYYKVGKKKGKGARGGQEEAPLEVIRRHPGRKVKIAKARYDVGEATQGVTAEELSIERELDKEAFKSQKKHRAVSQKIGPKAQPQIKAKIGVVDIPPVVTLKEFAEKCGLPVPDVITALIKNGIIATINQKLDYDTAEIIAHELGVQIQRERVDAASEHLFERNLEQLLKEEDKKLLKVRPPVVSVMGHVDHGKTKLLDTIRNANVMAGEAGGITQHIGAYQVEKNGHKITFIDTPGHEAFTEMRARGAKATDIAILVVSAEEGVKAQTIEAIHHAQEAGIPIIVAINKMDRPNANPEKVKGELVEYGLQAEDWGGKTPMVPVSALTGDGIDKLLEMILLVAEIQDLKANVSRLAVGTVVEAHLDPNLGPVATLIINTGTLNMGDDIVVGSTYGRIKRMQDHTGKDVKKAEPSAAVLISGLPKVPQAGEIMQAFKDPGTAKAKAEEIADLMLRKEETLAGSMTDRIVSQIASGNLKYVKLVIKADTKGSLEAIMQSLQNLKSQEVAVKVIHYGVGNITSTDVVMAGASQALLVGFHVDVGAHIKKMAEKEHVDVRQYTVIYKLIEDIKAMLSGMLEPEIRVTEIGKLKVLQIFLDKKSWAIMGCKVTEGQAEKGSMVRLVRNGETLFETKLESLKHVKQDVSIMEKGGECGIQLKTPKPVEVGDTLELFKVEKIERKLQV